MIISGSAWSFRLSGIVWGFLAAIAVLAIVNAESVSSHGCQSRGLCCQGKNNDCRSTRFNNTREPSKKPKLKKDDILATDDQNNDEGTDEDKKRKACFCDSACLDLGDCCDDYKDFCKPVDCVVAEKWGEWGACDARCGPGVKQRTRQILRVPLNGGQPCNSTVEKIACEGTNCKVARAPEGLEQLGETGKIIPASFGLWRKSKVYDPFRDIRKNLFDHYRAKEVVNRPSYCIRFEVTEVQTSCNSTDDQWSNSLTSGAEVCVECQTLAMHKQLGGRCLGQGVLLRETRWKAVLRPGCHGKWVMQSRQEDCHCDPESLSSFVLL